MTPHHFRQVRKLYKQTQAQWAETLGYDGVHAHCTVNRIESARVSIPGPIAKLVTLLEEAHGRKKSHPRKEAQ